MGDSMSHPAPVSFDFAPASQSPVLVILCYGYIGTDYSGLQFNPKSRTVESDLIHAMTPCKLIPPSMIHNKSQTQWIQDSRTAKGVHCCSQILSFQCRLPNGICISDLPKILTANLPPDSSVRFWGALSWPSQFNSQRLAEAFRYSYLAPFQVIGESAYDFVKRDVMPQFVGQHNFHNYTKHVSSMNPSAVRTVHEFSLSAPFCVRRTMFVLFTIRGNAFMLNQIRKMIGTVVAIVKGAVAFEREGLFLEGIEYATFLRAQNPRGVAHSRDIEFRGVGR
jgi:tRNA pseudouridine38-40 synthase